MLISVLAYRTTLVTSMYVLSVAACCCPVCGGCNRSRQQVAADRYTSVRENTKKNKELSHDSAIPSEVLSANATRAHVDDRAFASSSSNPSSVVSKPFEKPVAHAFRRPVHDVSTPELHLGSSAVVTFRDNTILARTKYDSLIISKCNDVRCDAFNTQDQPMARWPVAVTSCAPSCSGLSTGAKMYAYWVSKNKLLRRFVTIDGIQGPLEELTTDAGQAVLVAAARSAHKIPKDVVLYLSANASSQQQIAPNVWQARLWVQDQGSHVLAQDAASVSSFALIHLGLARFAVLTLDGRLGMSPLHSRYVELDAAGKAIIGPDQVAFVAGPTETMITLAGAQLGQGPVVFLPIFKDAQNFGLLLLRVGFNTADGQHATASWIDYPNGLDPAPVATANVCGKPMVAFVRPSSSKPGSSQVLELGVIEAQGQHAIVSGRRLMADWQRISHVALGGTNQGGWLVYTTEHGLRARRVNCQLRDNKGKGSDGYRANHNRQRTH